MRQCGNAGMRGCGDAKRPREAEASRGRCDRIPASPNPRIPYFKTPVTSLSLAFAAAGSTTMVPVIAAPCTPQSYL